MKKSIKDYLYAAGAAKVRNYFQALRQRDILFVWIPKSAGTSIFHLLEENGGRRFYSVAAIQRAFPNRGIATFGHLKLHDLLNHRIISKKYYQSAYKFTFVRNPYDRTVSIFSYYKEIQRIDAKLEFKAFCEQIHKDEYLKCGLFNDTQISHCNPQTSYIFDESDSPLVDFIGKFETLENDLNLLSKELNLEYNPLKRLNTSKHAHYCEYYDDESAGMIKSAYARDFKLLEYESDLTKNCLDTSHYDNTKSQLQL